MAYHEALLPRSKDGMDCGSCSMRKNYSNDTRKDHAVIQGAKTNDASKNAPIKDKCAEKSTPAIFACTAPDPKINIGI